jgi:thiamine biosynthesis lipoprotein ApbE
LKLPSLVPLLAFDSAMRAEEHEEHHFQYEGVIGTSMDLVVWTTNSRVAESACRRALGEIDRLASILNTRDPGSEISRLEADSSRHPSHELREVLDTYDYWERRTNGVLSIRPGGERAPRNLDALGKAYIIDRVSAIAKETWPSINALLLNIGGDIVTWGRSCEIAIADPAAWYDNAAPIARIALQDAAVATSGTYARGAHLVDGRNRQALKSATAATVVASNAVTANALATTLCLTTAEQGFQLVESTPSAEALRVASHGVLQRTPGFAFLERPFLPQARAETNWPHGYRLTVALPLKAGHSSKRPYVAVWVEDSSGKLIRILGFWANKSKYYATLSTLWSILGGNETQLKSVSRATRPAGKYELQWDGLDNQHRPVSLGSYRITVETNQEHGTYARQTGTIDLGESPTSINLPATTNFDEVLVQYGPR